ncbi:hypothetical protein [Paenibacillus sp. FJAT-26967]|uniref:hypothetical protein n=1 Tax=Paenibacillus sp. FJAT-26967 TaxID=1729690 RepID=UPI000837D91D|nr:hypothetical protein [Paenibacillus sp. FJAT-26967]
MNVKVIGVAFYIMLIYGVSKHFPAMHSLFFPALGAFSFLFISRKFTVKDIGSISLGAVLASVIGTAIYYLIPGIFAMFINTLIIIWLNKLKWNAPPILAVSFIPFFTVTANFWDIPLAISASLLGLMGTLLLVEIIETKIPFAFGMKNKLAPDTEKIAS